MASVISTNKMSKLYYTVIEVALHGDDKEIVKWLNAFGAKEIKNEIPGFIEAQVDYSTYKNLEKLPGVSSRTFEHVYSDDHASGIRRFTDDRLDALVHAGVIERYEYVTIGDVEQLVLHFMDNHKLRISAGVGGECSSSPSANLFFDSV